MFHKKLIALAGDRGMSQKDLCVLTGISNSSMSLYFGGHNMPSIQRIEAIAQALDVPTSALLDDVPDIENRKAPTLKKIPVSEAARRLGTSADFIRAALEQGTAPFGFAAKVGDTWRHHISPYKFQEYIAGEA